MAEQIDKGDVASLLAKSQALTPAEGTQTPVNVKPNPTPEEALRVLEEHEAKQVNAVGEEVVVPEVEEQTEVKVEEDKIPEPDLTGLSLDEQIEALNKYKEQVEAKENPLASVEKQAKDKGVDIASYEKEYASSGELSEDSLKALKEAGFDKVAVDAYIETRRSKADAQTKEAISDVCGSTDNFEAMATWMQESLTKAELDAYNKGVQTPEYKIYLENMYLKYSNANPTPARVVRGDGQPVRSTNDNGGFKSDGEMILAMQDPRYQRDVQYRREVQNKVRLMR